MRFDVSYFYMMRFDIERVLVIPYSTIGNRQGVSNDKFGDDIDSQAGYTIIDNWYQ